MGLNEFNLVNVLFFLTVVAGQQTVLYVEESLHGLVVGDALGVVAFYDTTNLCWGLNGFLLYDLVVADDAENDIWSYYGETGNLVVGEELVRHLDNAFAAHLL